MRCVASYFNSMIITSTFVKRRLVFYICWSYGAHNVLAASTGVVGTASNSNNTSVLQSVSKSVTEKLSGDSNQHAKKDVKVKNLSSWSSLANLPSAQSPAGGLPRVSTQESFELFKKQKTEREERERLQKEQSIRRQQQHEHEMKEKMRLERERQREREEEEVLEKARRAQQEAATKHQQQTSTSSSAPSAIEREFLREQERRRRQALANQIDMNAQSDLMASFEKTL